jgi:hypothetical protein
MAKTSNREFIFNGFKKVPKKGLCIAYSLMEESGELREGGLISVDMGWIKTCARSRYVNTWRMMMPNDTCDWHYMIYATDMELVQVDKRLILWAKDIVFENMVLLSR